MSRPGMAVGRDFARLVRDSFATGVAVVTMNDDVGARGITISAWTAVSVAPPLIAISVRHGASSCAVLDASGRFAVNLLAEDQQRVAEFFAVTTPPRNRMGGFSHHASADGLPHIDRALAWLDCEIVAATEYSEHRLFLGAAVAASLNRPGAAPLLFFRGQYRSLLLRDERRYAS